MRYAGLVASGVLVSAAVFTSCTCHKQIAPLPPFQERPEGFHASGPKPTPHVLALKPTQAPPTPAQLAQGGTPTPPAAIPADFPSDVPIFKGAEVQRVQDLANNAHNVVFTTPAAVVDVYQFYNDSMGQQGWKQTQQYERPEHSFLSFQKGDMVANITIAADPTNPGKQVIAVMYEHQKPLPFKPF